MINVLLHIFLISLPALSFGEETTVLLWVPSETFSDWAAVSKALEEYSDLRLTIGLTPEMASEPESALLKPWIEQGRVEAALRIEGDPLLPIIALEGAAPRPQDVVHRLAAARELFRQTLTSAPPAGFIPGGGFFAPELLPAFKAMNLSWIASGGQAPLGSWEGPVVVSFRPFVQNAEEAAAWVVDEASGRAPPGFMLGHLAFLARERPRQKWKTVGQALAAAEPKEPVLRPADWARELFTGTEAQERAWAAYHAAAAALKRYQNSGSASLSALEEAAAALYSAQDSSLYRRLADPLEAPAADEKLRSILLGVYRKIKAPAPASLLRPEEGSPDFSAAQTETSLAFENPKSTGPGRLQGLRVSWTAEELQLSYRLTPDPLGLGAVRLDTYIDLNGRPGAGSTALLEGRDAYAQNRDAWEFALEIFGATARLWRSSPLGPPEETARCSVSLDEARSEVRVVVPRAKLPGNPLRWAYIAFPLAPGQSVPLNVLGPKEAQKDIRRLSAVGASGPRR